MNQVELQTPPHSLPAEQALLGAILNKSTLLADVDLDPAEFYRAEHQAMFAAMRSLQEDRKAIDPVTLCDVLADNGKIEKIGLEYIVEVSSNSSGHNVSHYAEIVRAKFLARQLIAKGQEVAALGWSDGDIEERISKAQGLVTSLQVANVAEARDINQCIKDAVGALEKRFESGNALIGLSTGFADIDKRTQGLRDGHLIIIAGRPGMGKTTLAMNVAEHNAMAGKFVIVFSLEMSEGELTDKMLCSIGRIDYERMQDGKVHDSDWDKLSSAVAKMRGRDYFIDDYGQLTSGSLLSRARRIAQKVGRKPDLVVVDYMQLLRDKGEGVDRVTGISRNLKNAARDLNCPLIALSQLSRKCEDQHRKPIASDLRDSGSIEQDADLIYMLYREEEYNKETQNPGLAEAICAKWRFGKKGTDILNSTNLGMCRFENSNVKFISEQLAQARGKRELSYAKR